MIIVSLVHLPALNVLRWNLGEFCTKELRGWYSFMLRYRLTSTCYVYKAMGVENRTALSVSQRLVGVNASSVM